MMSLGSDFPEDQWCHRRLRGDNDEQSRLDVSSRREQFPSGGLLKGEW
jgi:hypothetical protein